MEGPNCFGSEWSCVRGRDVKGDVSSSSDDGESLITSSTWHRMGETAGEFSFTPLNDADVTFAFSGQKLNSSSD